MKKIVLITVSQPSINPRLVKEANALQEAGYDVTVIYQFVINWANEKDIELLRHVTWKYKIVGGTPHKNKWYYQFTRFRYKIFKELSKRGYQKYLIAERAQARSFDELLGAARAVKASWYIAHNLGALAVAVKAATFSKGCACFDFEDYHRDETVHSDIHVKNRISFLEDKYVPCLSYISAASPLIAKKIEENFPSLTTPVITLLNCFPLRQQPEFVSKKQEDNTLQLFWFSQTLGKNRGLESLIDALAIMNDPAVFLTLAGNSRADLVEYIDQHARHIKRQVTIAGVIPPDKLPAFSAKFDVGLALEPGFSLNNNIALSNKIFTYLLAGNAVIFSETPMQKAFNDEFKTGLSFKPNDTNGLIECIKKYKDISFLEKQRRYNYELAANKLNWENESVKLLKQLQPGLA